jgi:hypothetical protein
VPLLVAIPNVAWALGASRSSSPALTGHPAAESEVLILLERIGRVALFVVPCFYPLVVVSSMDRACLGVGALALIVYYLAWGRYFLQGRAAGLLLSPLGGLPVPLAVSPVVAFLAACVLTRSVLLTAVTLAFGFAHVSLSLRRAKAA